MSSLNRLHCVQKNIVVDTHLATCTIIPYQGWAGGMIAVPVGSAITTITWYAATSPDDTFYAAKDGIGGAVTTTIAASQTCLIPAALFGSGALKAVGNADGTIDISLKS